jgi:hypothetical protein
MADVLLIAKCERCGGEWRAIGIPDIDVANGICGDCQADSDVERPLTFDYASRGYAMGLPDLPEDWSS